MENTPTIDYDQALEELLTIRDMLRWASSAFEQSPLYYGHGTDNPWDEAVALMMGACHLPLEITPDMLDAKLTRNEREHVIGLVKKRVEDRCPVPYLTHKAWFAGLPFYVNEHVLIPRSPLAEWIERGFEPWLEASDTTRILDLCTGSGCIAIACAKAFPGATVDAVDISPEALEVAKRNVEAHDVGDRVNLYTSDLFEALKGRRYDLIISNPPYVGEEEYASLPEEYRHEPELGFVAGKDGLSIVDRMFKEAKGHLTPHGILVVEVGNTCEVLADAYKDMPFVWLECERGGDGVFLIPAPFPG